MSTQAYREWVARGRPWRLARPIADVQNWARRNGIAVLGTIGNLAHLTAKRPQDHTPYSATAWPDPLPGDIVTAIDLYDTPGLADAILAAAREDTLPWLKYANLGGRHYDCRDGFRDSSHSSDTHIHLSARTDHLDTALADDWINNEPPPAKPSRPAPGTPIDFPLPAGHWFGRDDGTTRSHSGLHKRRTAGKLDRTWITAFADQLKRRGWAIGKRRTWLPGAGNDGKFGPEYDALVRAFQRDQGLAADGKVGPRTWNAAYTNPIN